MGQDSRTGKGGGKGGAPVKPRFTVHADGRVGRPDIFRYRLQDGTLVDVPPTYDTHPDLDAEKKRRKNRPSLPYTFIVYDMKKFTALQKSGWIYSPEHTGRLGKRFDARRTS